jgi:4-aminobutyrate aminotransferase/(S)-3-amino-2-methylpropionate transaminase
MKDFFGKIAPDMLAAVVVEPVQGEGGFITPPKEYFPKLAKICKDNGILIIADEIQSGMARTGKQMFAIEHWGVEPDLMTVAKSLAAGMPLSAVVGRQEIMDSVHPGGIGGTYGGNPVCCAAALAVLDVYEEEKMLDKSEKLGKKVRKYFNELKAKHEVIGDVRGLGPMLALELVKDRKPKEPAPAETAAVVKYAFEKGLNILSCGQYSNVIRTMMPLVITDSQLAKGVTILDEAFASLKKKK